MYDVTLIYPDCDLIAPGKLYLPGERCPEATPEDCGICQTPMTERNGWGETQNPTTGDHAGIVWDVTAEHAGGQPGYSEPMHLRCVLDTGTQYGSIGMTVGNIDLGPIGRHALVSA